MQKCTSCGVKLTGSRKVCPLCGKKLDDVPETESYGIFPNIPVHVTYDFIFKISTFSMIVAIIVVHMINFTFLPNLAIYLPLSLSAICAWIIINVGFKKRKNIPKNIMYEAVIAIVLCLIWDHFTGWRGWSYHYVLPSIAGALCIFYFVMGIVDTKRLSTYVPYFITSELALLFCAILLFCGLMEGVARYFTVISLGIGLTLLIAQIVFRGKTFASELYRWLHM